MSSLIDLHVHSEYSFDCNETIKSIIETCLRKNIETIAITDHNEVEGSKIAMQDERIKVVPGIEIDCTFKDTVIHIVGYGIDVYFPDFQKVVDHYQSELKRIGKERIEILNQFFEVNIDEKKCIDLANGKPYTNVEITNVLLQDFNNDLLRPYIDGERSNSPVANFYWDYCCIGKPCYVGMNLPTYQETIDLIHRAKGIAIVAHPGVNLPLNEAVLDELLEAGISGLEIYNNYHDDKQIQFFMEYCKEHQLLFTIGSDFHGNVKPNIHLGQTNYPYNNDTVLLSLLTKIQEHRKENALHE